MHKPCRGTYFWTMRILLAIGTILILTASCQERFNSKKWKIKEDLGTYPFREAMVGDIIEHKNFIGLKYRQLIDSLGEPSRRDKNRIYYSIETDYGRDVDPVYTSYLVLVFDKDSLVKEIKIEEWKK